MFFYHFFYLLILMKSMVKVFNQSTKMMTKNPLCVVIVKNGYAKKYVVKVQNVVENNRQNQTMIRLDPYDRAH